MMKLLWIFLAMTLILSCQAQTKNTMSGEKVSDSSGSSMDVPGEGISLDKVRKTRSEWRTQLTEQEYKIIREAGTEPAFTGDLWDNKKTGTYTCAACQLPLFSSATKFKSGTGWPSFYQPLKSVYVDEKEDNKYGWKRVEVLCARCDGHLGHVFTDGPEPTGLRYCINSYSMDFVEEGNK